MSDYLPELRTERQRRWAVAQFMELIELFATEREDWEQIKDGSFDCIADLIVLEYAPDLLCEPFPLNMERYLRKREREKKALHG